MEGVGQRADDRRMLTARGGTTPVSGLPLAAALRWMVSQPRFHLMWLSVFLLCPVSEFNALVPIYLSESTSLSTSDVAFASAVMPCGAVTALAVGFVSCDGLTRKQRAGMVCALLFTCTAALTVLAAVGPAAMPLWAVLACLFTVGASYSTCYYLPVGAFCLEFGGQWCATLSGLLDVAGYMSVIPFNVVSGRMANEYGWWSILALLAVSASLCAVTFTVFMVMDARSHEALQDADHHAFDEGDTARVINTATDSGQITTTYR